MSDLYLNQDSIIGDLVFLRPTAQDWQGQIIARATAGPYCHVQVRVAADAVIEARARGVTRSALAAPPPEEDVAHIGWTLEGARLAHALTWLRRQVGQRYDWLAVLADGVKTALPAALGSRAPFLVAPSRLDCSELAARFLTLAGYMWLPDEQMMTPQRVSPNDLARALKPAPACAARNVPTPAPEATVS